MVSVFGQGAVHCCAIARQSAVICLVQLFTVFFAIAQAGDTTDTGPVRLDISGGFYHQIGLAAGSKREEIVLPDYLSVRRPQEPELANTWGLNNDRVTDSPMGHGASYIRFHSWYNITKEVELYGSLAANHAGFSFGPYNTFALTILPRYHVDYRQRFGIGADGADSLALRGKIGLFEDVRNGEGLMVYNLDVQGLLWEMQWNKLVVSVQQIGDLQACVGLAIDGLADFRVGLRQLEAGSGWLLDINADAQNFTDTRHPKGIDVVSVSGALYNGDMRVYGEAGYRFSDYDFDAVLNYAALLGVRGKMSLQDVALDCRAEYRHYGGGFNYRLRDENSTHYRDTDRPPGANYIGNQVYPIEYLNRPFSQWAVFTEYDKRWTDGVSIAARCVYQAGARFQLLAETDLNLVVAEGEDAFLYPFFKAGVRFEAVPETYLAATVTNKTMNLDKHYTTYYLLRYPVFQLELRRDISL